MEPLPSVSGKREAGTRAQYLGRNAHAHSKHTSAFGAEMYGVGLPIGDGFRGSRARLGLFLYSLQLQLTGPAWM